MELAVIRPCAPSTLTSPSTDLADTNVAPPLIVMSPRTVSAATSLRVPSTEMAANAPSILIGIQTGTWIS